MPTVYHGTFVSGSTRPFELGVTIVLIISLIYLELLTDESEEIPKSKRMLPFLILLGTMVGYIVLRPFISGIL